MDDSKATRSGLDSLREHIATWHTAGMPKTLDMHLVELAEGKAVLEGRPTARFYNAQGRVHGGYAAALIDDAMGCAVRTKLPQSVGFGTIEMNVSYVRKLDAESGKLLCEATVLHAGRTLFTVEAKVTDKEGKLCAHGSGTFLIYPK